MTDDLSLEAFAAEQPPSRTGYVAWIESIPEWPEIAEAWQSGRATQAQIREWLIEVRGYSHDVATRNKVAHLSKMYPRTRRRARGE